MDDKNNAGKLHKEDYTEMESQQKTKGIQECGEVKVPANDLQVWSMRKLLTVLTSCFKIMIWKYASTVDKKSSMN